MKLKLISYICNGSGFFRNKKEIAKSFALKIQNCWLSQGYGGIVKLSSGKRATKKDFFI